MVDRIHCTCPNRPGHTYCVGTQRNIYMTSFPTYYCCKVRLLKMKVTMWSPVTCTSQDSDGSLLPCWPSSPLYITIQHVWYKQMYTGDPHIQPHVHPQYSPGGPGQGWEWPLHACWDQRKWRSSTCVPPEPSSLTALSCRHIKGRLQSDCRSSKVD